MTNHNVNIRFPKEPKPRKRHKVWDCLGILFAAALVGSVTNGIVFGVVGGLGILVYLLQSRNHGD